MYCFAAVTHYVQVIRPVLDSERVNINHDYLSPEKVSTFKERLLSVYLRN